MPVFYRGVDTIEKKKKIRAAVNIVLLAAFILLLVFVTVKYGPGITRLVRSREEFRTLLVSYGCKSAFIFMFFQILQVVIAVIPGEFIQIAGGYVFGTTLGTFFSILGILCGSIIVFFITRLLGYPLVKTFVPEKRLKKFDFLMNSEKSEVTMLILFLIPGVPKDVLTYIAGLTPIKPVRFFIIAMAGRLPALFVSAFIGSSIQAEKYLAVIIASIAAVALFVAGILLKDKVVDRVHRVIGRDRQ